MKQSDFALDKGDYALLNAVWFEDWGAWLMAKEETMTGINAPFHGLGEDELLQHFFMLRRSSLIECSRNGFETIIDPDLDLARVHLRDFQDWPLCYRLTRAGGGVWEYYSSVDWGRFFSSHVGSNEKEWTLSASNRLAIELSLRCKRIRPDPVKGTEKWEILEPWQVTYWKALPAGYRLTYRYEDWKRPAALSEDEIRAWEEFAPYWSGWHKSFEEVCTEHFGCG